jgi:hypothetical protein
MQHAFLPTMQFRPGWRPRGPSSTRAMSSMVAEVGPVKAAPVASSAGAGAAELVDGDPPGTHAWRVSGGCLAASSSLAAAARSLIWDAWRVAGRRQSMPEQEVQDGGAGEAAAAACMHGVASNAPAA